MTTTLPQPKVHIEALGIQTDVYSVIFRQDRDLVVNDGLDAIDRRNRGPGPGVL